MTTPDVEPFVRRNAELRAEVRRLSEAIAARRAEDRITRSEYCVRVKAKADAAVQHAQDAQHRVQNLLADLMTRQPALVEVHTVSQCGFLRRLWWALGFAFRGRCRCEINRKVGAEQSGAEHSRAQPSAAKQKLGMYRYDPGTTDVASTETAARSEAAVGRDGGRPGAGARRE